MAGVEKPVDEKSIVFDYSDNNLNTNLIAKKISHISTSRLKNIKESQYRSYDLSCCYWTKIWPFNSSQKIEL